MVKALYYFQRTVAKGGLARVVGEQGMASRPDCVARATPTRIHSRSVVKIISACNVKFLATTFCKALQGDLVGLCSHLLLHLLQFLLGIIGFGLSKCKDQPATEQVSVLQCVHSVDGVAFCGKLCETKTTRRRIEFLGHSDRPKLAVRGKQSANVLFL